MLKKKILLLIVIIATLTLNAEVVVTSVDSSNVDSIGLGSNYVHSSSNSGEAKITICHYPPGNPANVQTIEISQSAWPAHQAHGDTQGGCDDDDGDDGSNGNGNNGGNGNNSSGGEKIIICHYPPGNPANVQTIEISVAAWAAHQAHGDSQGNCEPPANAGTDQTICDGESVQIGGPSELGAIYSWSPTTGLSCATCADPIATPLATTTYTLTITNTGQTYTSTDQVTVTVESDPIANAGNNQTICPGETLQIGSSVVSGYVYSWSPTASLDCNNCAEPIASPNTNTTYTLITTNNCGTDSDNITISIGDEPIAEAGADQTFCQNGSVILGAAAVAGNSYNWSPSTGLSCTSCAQPSVSVGSNITYTLVVTNACGSATDNVTLSVVNGPVANAGADQTICPGENVLIGAAGQAGNTYSWSPSVGLSCTNCANPTATPSTTTVYTVTVSNSSCPGLSTDQVTVTVLNQPLADAGPDQTHCVKGSVMIGSPAVAGNSYNWSPSLGLSCSTCAQPTASVGNTTNYTLVVTNACGSATDQVTVTLGAGSIANAGPDQTICPRESTVIGTIGTTGNSYAWTPSAGLSCTTCAQPTANPSSTTIYTLTVQNNDCGTLTVDQVTVNVEEAPFVDAGPDQIICQGESVQIGGNGQNGNIYLWTPAAGLSCNNCPNPTASPNRPITYTLTVKNPNCPEVATDQVSITIQNPPIADAGSDQSICPKGSTTIGTPFVTGNTYSWTPSIGLSCTTCAEPTVSVGSTTNYTLVVTNACGSATDQVNVSIGEGFVADAGPDRTICPKENTVIGTPALAGNSYQWSPSTGLSCTSCAQPTASPSSTTVYTLVVLNDDCGTKTVDQVTVNVEQAPIADAGPDLTICLGETVQIGTVGQNGNKYRWTPAVGLSCSNCPNPTVTPTQTVTYTLTVTNKNCRTKSKDQVTITITDAPTANAGLDQEICEGESVAIGSTGQAGNIYYWSPSTGLSCATCPNPTASPNSTTLYTVTVSNPNCPNTATDQVTVNVKELPTANAGSDQTICPKESVTIGSPAIAGTTYNWSPSTGLSCTTCAQPTAAPGSTTLYTLEASNFCGTVEDQVSVSLQENSIADAGDDQTICLKGTVTLGTPAVSGLTYSWQPSTGLSCTTCAQPTSSIGSTITYTLTVTNVRCRTSSTDQVTVLVVGKPVADAGVDQNICGPGTVTIGSAAIAGSTYEWIPATGLSCSNCAQPTAVVSSTTIYTLITTNACGSNKDQVTVNVVESPLANAGEDQTICPKEQTTIGSASVAGNTYNWTPSTGLSCTTCAQPTASPGITTVYTVEITNACGTATDQVTVSVIEDPMADAGADQTICLKGSVTLGTPAVPGLIYSWAPTTGLSCSNCAQPTASIGSTIDYTLTVTNEICKTSSTDQVTVLVVGKPVADAGVDQNICGPGTVTIGSAAIAGTTYEWIPSTGLSCTTCAQPTSTVSTTTTYTLITTNACGSNKDQVTVNVVESPLANAGEDQTICPKEQTTIGSASVAGNTYNWTPSTGLSCTTCAQPSAFPGITTVYTLEITNACGTATDQVTVSVIEDPIADAGADQTICLKGSVTLGTPAVPGLIYSWAPTTGLSCSNCAQPTASIGNTTDYTLTVTNELCKTSSTDQVTVLVVGRPFANVGEDQSLCGPGTVTLGGPAIPGTTYQWIPSTGLSCSSCAQPTATVSATTSYVLLVSNACGSTKAQVNVYVVDTPIADAGVDQTICEKGVVTIGSASVPGNTYSWTPSIGLNCTTCAQPTASPGTTTNYSLTITNACGTATDQVTVTIAPNPVANVGTDQTICVGESTTIGGPAIAGLTYNWTPSTGLSCTTCSEPTFTAGATTTYSLTVVGECGTAQSQVTVTVLDDPIADAGEDQIICIKGVPTLGTPAVPGYTYSWAPSNGLSCTDCAQPTAIVRGTVNYTLTVSNPCGSSTDQVTVTTLGSPIANAGADQTLCAGTALTLGTAAISGSSYAWSPANGLSCTTCAQPTATIGSNITYTLVVTNACGTTSDNVTFTLETVTSADAGPDQTICLGASAQIGISTQGNSTYTWTPITGLSCDTCSDPIASPVTTTTYTVTTVDVNCGTITTDQITVTVGENPLADAGVDQTICQGMAVQIGSSPQLGNVYSWSPSNGLSCTTCSNPTANPSSQTTYTLTVSNPDCGSESTDQVIVSISTLATSVSPSQETCLGNAVMLEATGGISYDWSPATGLSCTNCPNPNALPSTTTNYTVTITDAYGCEINHPTTVLVAPAFTIDAGANVSGCIGELVTLNATGATTYSWSPVSDLTCNTCPNPTADINGNITYTVTGFQGNCVATDVVVISLNDDYNLSFTYTIDGCNIFVQAQPSGLGTYAWSFGDGTTVSTGPSASHQYNIHGQYEVCVEVVGSCGEIQQVCQMIEIDALECNCLTNP